MWNSRLIKGMRYPGDGYYYVKCDVCDKKLRAKDAVLITDKYNLLNGMLVCPEDADKTNPRTYIRARKERTVRNPKLIRPEGEDTFSHINDESDVETGGPSAIGSRLPTAPQYLTIISGAYGATELQWLGPIIPGSAPISGYKIERESPVGGGFSVIEADTNSVASYYKDTTTLSSTIYNYRVSAITDVGTGSPSNEASITTDS